MALHWSFSGCCGFVALHVKVTTSFSGKFGIQLLLD